MSNTNRETFDHTHRRFVSYIDKSREFYLNKGFGNPYRWASNASAPFAALAKPLSECRVAVVTTAAADEEGGRNRRVYAGATAAEPAALHTEHLSWHKTATHTDELATYLPLRQLRKFEQAGRIGSVAPRFYGVPTKFSQRQTMTEHAPQILEMCRQDEVDIALLVAL